LSNMVLIMNTFIEFTPKNVLKRVKWALLVVMFFKSVEKELVKG
jgi:hypothetical protein